MKKKRSARFIYIIISFAVYGKTCNIYLKELIHRTVFYTSIKKTNIREMGRAYKGGNLK